MITKRRNIKLNDIWKYEQGKAQIGKRIKDERNKKKLSQQELADAISAMLNTDPDCKGIGQNTVSNWEKGITLPPLSKLIALSNIFGCDIGYLLCDYDEPTRNLADVVEQNGLSGEAVKSLVMRKTQKGIAGLDILSSLLSDRKFWEAISNLNYAKFAGTNANRPMSDGLKSAVLQVKVMNGIERHPGATILEPEQMRDMNLYHASQKFSECAARIADGDKNKTAPNRKQ